MKKTKAKRKLIIEEELSSIAHKEGYGVPISRIIKDHGLDISRPALITLIKHYFSQEASRGSDNYNPIHNSLFPSWLEQFDYSIQEQPDGWAYEGDFPLGKWIHEEDKSDVE